MKKICHNFRGLIYSKSRLPYNPKLQKRAVSLRKNMTLAEKIIWNNILRGEKFQKFKFLRQRIIDNYIVDFYCARLKLIIEIDGEIHQERQEYDKERQEYDKERTFILESYGLHVIRYKNEEVLKNIDKIKQNLFSYSFPLMEGD